MANVKISELPVAASVDGASSFPVVEGGVTKQVTFTGMLASPSLFASGMATFFATPSSANLRAALTDETGTGAAVFADSPTLTGAVSVTGTVAATKLIPTGNVTAGNGMYLPATNALAWSTNGVEGMRLDASGNLGVGTSSPVQRLHVNGNALLGGSPAAQWSGVTIASDVAIQSAAPLLNLVNAAGSTRFGYLYHTGAGGNIELLNQQAGAVWFGTNNTERMRIDSSGNVGIGTSSPGQKLDVVSGASKCISSTSVVPGSPATIDTQEFCTFKATAAVNGLTYSGTDPRLLTATVTPTNEIVWRAANIGLLSSGYLTLSTDFAERVRIDSSGNVGIGTNAPTEKLEVQGTAAGSAFAVRFSNTSSTANSAAVLSLDPGNNGFNVRDGQIRAINNGANEISLAFFTSSAATPAEAMRLDASGNLIAKVNSSAPSLGTNSTMSFELTSNTSLKIVVRGTDGTTRSVSLTLA